MVHSILLHEAEDDVGVAVSELTTGSEAAAITLEGRPAGSVRIIQDIPLGHKVAMHDIAAGQDIIEYGCPVGRAIQSIAKGTHVHIHNLKSKRWSP